MDRPPPDRPRALARAVSLVLALGVSTAAARVASACSYPGNPEHETAANAADTKAPTVTAANVLAIGRGQGPQKNGCVGGTTASSCDDLASIQIGVTGADEVSKPEELGWVLELDSGALPSEFLLPATAVRATAGAIRLVFIDGAQDDQESFDFVLRVSAVDAAGNRSAATKVAVSHGGVNSCGSHIAPRTGTSWTIAAVALAALFGRRLSKRRATR